MSARSCAALAAFCVWVAACVDDGTPSTTWGGGTGGATAPPTGTATTAVPPTSTTDPLVTGSTTTGGTAVPPTTDPGTTTFGTAGTATVAPPPATAGSTTFPTTGTPPGTTAPPPVAPPASMCLSAAIALDLWGACGCPTDCKSGFCMSFTKMGVREGGYCAQPCGMTAGMVDGTTCGMKQPGADPAKRACLDSMDPDPAKKYVCVLSCPSGQPCPAGLSCKASPGGDMICM